MYARRLRQSEGVMDYVEDLQHKRRELECMGVPEVASIAVRVYSFIACEQTQSVSRLRGGHARDQHEQDAVNLLLVAERTAQELRDRGSSDGGRGVQRQVNIGNHHAASSGNEYQHGGKRHHDVDNSKGNNNKKRNAEACKSCHKRGYWWKECSERQVIKKNGGPLHGISSAAPLSWKAPLSEHCGHTSRECEPEAPAQGVPRYAKIYTRHELAALAGRDLEERSARAPETQHEEVSIGFSPCRRRTTRMKTKKAVPIVRRVLTLATNCGTEAVPTSSSGSCSSEQLQHAEFVEEDTGTCERVGIAGSAL
ncbi:hypothetical protein GN958_ATG06266, partial [Phytophthora infestans]